MARHQYRTSSLVSQTSFHRDTSKVVALRNVGAFLRPSKALKYNKAQCLSNNRKGKNWIGKIRHKKGTGFNLLVQV